MVIEYREKVLQMAEEKPLLPNDVAKAMDTNTLMASAMLSEMSSKGLLKVSSLKFGSSPLYYLSDKKEQLLEYIQYLNEKDRKTVELLKEKQVFREAELDPLTRVSVRQIKDFAQPLEVTRGETREVFWKWYLLTDQEAEKLIKQFFEPKQKTLDTEPVEKPKRKRRPRKPAIAPDEFLGIVQKFFKSNNIETIEQIAIKKKSEYDFIIKLDSTVGALTYYCKAKNKKFVGEPDVSNAFVQGQLRKLPVLFLTTGDLNKQATLLAQELKGLTVKKI